MIADDNPVYGVSNSEARSSHSRTWPKYDLYSGKKLPEVQSEATQANIEATHERRSVARDTCLQLLERLSPDP